MTAPELGRLQYVDPRQVWAHEALGFTPWLADNIDRLGEALGLELEVVGREQNVGPFSADILARDATTERLVVIENMLEPSDHGHVGQLVTYAAGLEATYAVLVAPRLRPEHRSGLSWLNEISGTDHGFFGVEVSAVRIGDSVPAPLFDVVVRPDDWQRQVREAAGSQLTSAEQRYVEWWAEFLPELHERYPGWTSASVPQRASWINLPSGFSAIRYDVSWTWSSQDGSRFRVGLYLDRGAEHFPIFDRRRGDIEAAVAAEVSWEEAPENKSSRVACHLDDKDSKDRDAWPFVREWALDRLGEWRDVAQPIIDGIDR